MLTDIELKEKLIAQISSTNDGELLHQISRVIDLEVQIDETYRLSPDEFKAVKDGVDQIDNGLFLSNEEANKLIDKYLGK
jgi:hypothetical protein